MKNIPLMKPIVLIPGIGGSILVRKGYEHRTLLQQRVLDNRWINIYAFSRQDLGRWKQDMLYDLVLDDVHRVKGVKPKVDLEPYDFGGTRGLKDILPEVKLLPPPYQDSLDDLFHHRYMHHMCEFLYKHGYRDRESLFGAPYDFRLVLDPFTRDHYFQRLKQLIEASCHARGDTCVIVSHSLGGILFKWFASSAVDREWLQKHVASWICMSVPFGGSYHALRAVTSGEHYLPALRPMVKQEVQRNLGIITCLPNKLAFDEDDPVWFLHKLPVFLSDYGALGKKGMVPFQLWSDLFQPHWEEYTNPLSIETEVLYVRMQENKTEGVAFSNQWNKPPYFVTSTEGDGVVPLRSLLAVERLVDRSHLRRTVIPDADHTSVLNHPQVFQVLARHAGLRGLL